MSVWSGIAGTLGKVLSTAGPVMSAIPGLGTIPGVAASAAGGFLNQMASEEKQKDLYNQQLLYNSPKEQMSRLKEAGLNPNLIYGSQGVTGMSANDATAPNLEQYKENPVLKMSPQQIQEMAIQRQHQENENRMTTSNESLNKERENTERAKQKNLEQNTSLQAAETLAKENYNSLFHLVESQEESKTALAKLSVDAQEIQNQILGTKKAMTDQELTEMIQSWPTRMNTLTVELDNKRKQGKLIDANVARQYAEMTLIPLQANLLRAQEGMVSAQTVNEYKRSGLLDQQGKINKAKINQMRLDYANAVANEADKLYHSNDVSVVGFKFPNPFVRRSSVETAYSDYLKSVNVDLSY